MFDIRPMQIEDYDDLLALWQATEGVGLSRADEREPIQRYLDRNPGLSFVAVAGGKIVGTLLVGHDGRRGYLHHLAVSAAYRQQGIGRTLVDHALAALRSEGIDKCHLFVFGHNAAGRAFWRQVGWQERPDLEIMSKDTALKP